MQFNARVRQLVVAAVVIAAVAAMVVLAGLPRVGDVPAATQHLDDFEKNLSSVEAGLQESARDRWDPDYVVEQVGTEPQQLLGWVRDNTAWVPYHGALRGPVGVLNDRLGNSLDRAALLATLLDKAGHEVRLARRQLDEREAYAAISSAMWAEPGAASMEDSPPAIITPSLAARSQSIDAFVATLDNRVADQTRRLLATVAADSPSEEWTRRMRIAVAAAQDHWWVQRKDGDAWTDLDITDFPLAAPVEYFAIGELAPQRHELTVRVIAERFAGGKTTERPVLEHSWSPSQAMGRSVALQFWPSQLRPENLTDSDPQRGFRALALEQERWDVVLTIADDMVAHGSMMASGKLVDAAQGGPMGALAGRAFGQAGNDPPQSGTLSAVWIEYEIRSPAQQSRRIRRQVFDLLGPAARSSGNLPSLAPDETARLNRSLALTLRTEILPVNTAFAPEYVGNLAARSLIADRDLLRAATRGEVQPDDARFEELLNGAAPAFTPLYSLALARTEWSRLAEQIFIDELNVLARHRFLAWTDAGLVVREANDIVANEVGVELAATDAFAIRVEQGVFDTNAERALQIGGRGIGNTAEAFSASNRWITLRAGSGTQSLKIADDLRARIAMELDAGHAIVAPSQPVVIGGEPFMGWWRIDTATGDTLGVAANGWGQSMTERGVQYNVFSEVAKRFVFDYLLCRSMPAVVHALDVPLVKELFPIETSEQAHKGCMISAMVSGAAVATLPLLLAALKYAGRSASSLVRGTPARAKPGLGAKPPGKPKARRPCV